MDQLLEPRFVAACKAQEERLLNSLPQEAAPEATIQRAMDRACQLIEGVTAMSCVQPTLASMMLYNASRTSRLGLRFFVTYEQICSKVPLRMTLQYYAVEHSTLPIDQELEHMERVNHVKIIFEVFISRRGPWASVIALRNLYDDNAYVAPSSGKACARKLGRIVGRKMEAAVLTPQESQQFIAKMLHCGEGDARMLWLSNMRVCNACSRFGLTLAKCGGCLHVYYCSATCQTADWRAKHKSVCDKSAIH
jgi:hypothetical protein